MSRNSSCSDVGNMSMFGNTMLDEEVPSNNTSTDSMMEPETGIMKTITRRPCKRGRTIPSEARCIIANVIKYFDDEAVKCGDSLITKRLSSERAANAVGVSISTIAKIRKSEDPEHPTPGKHRSRDTVVQLSDFNKCVLRRTIQEFYVVQKQVPSGALLKIAMKEKVGYNGGISSLRQSMSTIGFKWKKSAVKGKVLVEAGEMVRKRSNYLRNLRRFRSEKRNIVYIDETWVSMNLKFGKCWQSDDKDSKIGGKNSGKRIVFVHAGGEQGFVPGAQLHFNPDSRDGVYHGEMTIELFMKWLTEKLLPNLPENSVIVMDNAPYHSNIINKVPDATMKRQNIQDWLSRRGIAYGECFRVPELLHLVNKHKEGVRYEVDEKVLQHGHIVLRLPPNHCDLNPIEYVWDEVRHLEKTRKDPNNITESIEFTKRAFNAALQNWENYCQQVRKLEIEYWDRDYILDELQHSVMDIVSNNNDSDSSSAS